MQSAQMPAPPAEQASAAAPSSSPRVDHSAVPTPRHRIVIVGAGFTGLAMAIELKRAGVDDFVILERADAVGGVWRDNDYPGVAVDTPSKIYNLAAMLNPEWSSLFAEGAELKAYTHKIAADFGLLPHVRFGQAVERMDWQEARSIWRIETAAGDTFEAQVLVSAAGLVADPHVPAIPGLDAFPGEVFHSSRWNHDLDLTGKRVAVIGTGASAIQFVPEIQPKVSELHVLQRTPTWITPKPHMPMDEKSRRRLRRVPGLMRLERFVMYWMLEYNSLGRTSEKIRQEKVKAAQQHLEEQVADPELRAKLTPDFEFLCKRPLISSTYYPALCAANTQLHTGGLAAVRGSTVVAGDGTEAEVDVLILNTGFEIGQTTPIARRLRGRDGRSLSEQWGILPTAYKGVSIPNFPNFFLMQGPNATSGVSSALVFAEAQAKYIASAAKHVVRHDLERFEVRAEKERTWTRRVRQLSAKTVYEVGGCRSYYLNDEGINVVMWPGFTAEYQLKTRRFDPAAYEVTKRTGARRAV